MNERRKAFLKQLNSGRSWSDAEKLIKQMGVDQIVELSEAGIRYLQSFKEFYVPAKRIRARERVQQATFEVYRRLQRFEKVEVRGVCKCL